MNKYSEIEAGILKGYGRERPESLRVFVPFPKGISLSDAKAIEQKYCSTSLDHHHVEKIDENFYLHVKPGRETEKYLKLKEKLAMLS
jgi:hypothetical protein